MAPRSREKIGEAAQEVADHLMLVEHVKVLQQGQKQMADAIALIDSRLRQFEADVRAAKAETKLEEVRETTHLLQSVQGAFQDRLTHLTVKVAQLENRDGVGSSLRALSTGALQDGPQVGSDNAMINRETTQGT
jgi:predicted translin family RNA/ssDNA-binding protein